MQTRRIVTLLTSATLAIGSAVIVATPAQAAPFEPLDAPQRIADTRPGGETVDGVAQRTGIQAADTTLTVPVAGRAGLPASVSSVILNVTAVAAQGGGFLTVFACDAGQPDTSNLNYGGGNIANTVIAKVSAQGTICVYTSATTHILVDVAGSLPADAYLPLVESKRLLDTRPNGETTDGVNQNFSKPTAGRTIFLKVAGRGGIAEDATSVALNVTSVAASAGGFISVDPCSSGDPESSNLNFSTGQNIANTVVAKLSSIGYVCIYTSAESHILVDVAGTFPAETFVPLSKPERVADTRGSGETVDGEGAKTGKVAGGSTLGVRVGGRADVPAGASSVVLNVTSVAPEGGGFLTLYPQGASLPGSSNLNFNEGQNIANSVVARLGTDGSACVYTSATTHVIVDVAGYIIGPPPASSGPTCPGTPQPPPRDLPAGTFLEVGLDILPGRYEIPDIDQERDGIRGCAVGRLNKVPAGSIADPATDANATLFPDWDGRAMLDVRPEDVAIIVNPRCGPFKTYVPSGSPVAAIAPGMHVVGDHITPGTYTTPGGDDCFWARLSGFDYEVESYIEANVTLDADDNVILAPGPHTVTIQVGDTGFQSTATCGTWTKVA